MKKNIMNIIVIILAIILFLGVGVGTWYILSKGEKIPVNLDAIDTYIRAGDYEKARKTLGTYIKDNPKDMRAIEMLDNLNVLERESKDKNNNNIFKLVLLDIKKIENRNNDIARLRDRLEEEFNKLKKLSESKSVSLENNDLEEENKKFDNLIDDLLKLGAENDNGFTYIDQTLENIFDDLKQKEDQGFLPVKNRLDEAKDRNNFLRDQINEIRRKKNALGLQDTTASNTGKDYKNPYGLDDPNASPFFDNLLEQDNLNSRDDGDDLKSKTAENSKDDKDKKTAENNQDSKIPESLKDKKNDENAEINQDTKTSENPKDNKDKKIAENSKDDKDKKTAENNQDSKTAENKKKDKISSGQAALDKENLYLSLYSEGNKYFDQGNYGEAIKSYKKSIMLNKNFDKSFYNLGLSYFKQGNNKDALDSFDKALEINNKYKQAHLVKSEIYIAEGENKKAKDELLKIIDLDPSYAKAYSSYAFILYKEKNYPEAKNYFEKAKKLEPKNDRNFYSAAVLNLKNRNYKDAIANAKTAYALNGKSADNNYILAKAMLSAFNNKTSNEQAISYLKKAIELDKAHTGAKIELSSAYIKEKKYDEVLDVLDGLSNSGIPKVFNNRSVAYRLKGDFAKAIAQAEKAKSLNKNDPSLYYTKSLAYIASKDYKNAELELLSLLKVDKNFKNAYKSLGKVYINLGENTKAKSMLNKYLSFDANDSESLTLLKKLDQI